MINQRLLLSGCIPILRKAESFLRVLCIAEAFTEALVVLFSGCVFTEKNQWQKTVVIKLPIFGGSNKCKYICIYIYMLVLRDFYCNSALFGLVIQRTLKNDRPEV